MSALLGVGIIGCGNISTTYLGLAPLFRGIEMRSCADIDAALAAARASEFGVRACTVDELLASDDIDIVVNLTVPDAHFDVSRRVLESGRHVYSEKPLVLSLDEGRELAALADKSGLRIGSSPDTFLGGAHQRARALIDEGMIGRVTGGTAHVMNRGMEHWHPNPDFFFKPGAGPVLDLGPYYVTNLVQLLGPIRRVVAMSSTPRAERLITSEPRAGERLSVETPTTIHAVLEFINGALVTLGASWDVRRHGHGCMELYGESGTLHLPDPNFFGGELAMSDIEELRTPLAEPETSHPFGIANQEHSQGMVANYRTAGLAEMASAILDKRPHRCSLELALHVVDVLTAILRAAENGVAVELTTTCERPAPLDAEAARALLV